MAELHVHTEKLTALVTGAKSSKAYFKKKIAEKIAPELSNLTDKYAKSALSEIAFKSKHGVPGGRRQLSSLSFTTPAGVRTVPVRWQPLSKRWIAGKKSDKFWAYKHLFSAAISQQVKRVRTECEIISVNLIDNRVSFDLGLSLKGVSRVYMRQAFAQSFLQGEEVTGQVDGVPNSGHKLHGMLRGFYPEFGLRGGTPGRPLIRPISAAVGRELKKQIRLKYAPR